jgi:hypothetical protein
MGWSTDEISNIRALVADLLDDIGLKSYEFNIEQDQNNWIVSADFPHRGQWQTVDLRVDKTLLRHCLTHEKMRERLRSVWKNRLDHLKQIPTVDQF